MCPLDYKSQSYHIQSSQISSVFKDHAISKIWNENYRFLILETHRQTDKQKTEKAHRDRQTEPKLREKPTLYMTYWALGKWQAASLHPTWTRFQSNLEVACLLPSVLRHRPLSTTHLCQSEKQQTLLSWMTDARINRTRTANHQGPWSDSIWAKARQWAGASHVSEFLLLARGATRTRG